MTPRRCRLARHPRGSCQADPYVTKHRQHARPRGPRVVARGPSYRFLLTHICAPSAVASFRSWRDTAGGQVPLSEA